MPEREDQSAESVSSGAVTNNRDEAPASLVTMEDSQRHHEDQDAESVSSGAVTNNQDEAPASRVTTEDSQRSKNTRKQTEEGEESGMEDHWVKLAQELRDADKELVENINGSIDSLLTFAGLLSAVQSAFAIATYPLLQTASVVTSPLLQPPQPKASVVTMNIFVFSSLALALICASVGILRKTQLKQHLAWTSKRTDARSQIVERQFSYEINSRRMLWNSASHFSWGLNLSIGIFAIGIFVFLWTMDRFVALSVFLFACVALCVIFSRDISHYYVRFCLPCIRVICSIVHLMSPWDWLERVLGGDPRAGLLVKDHFHLLSHAILSRTSALTTSGVDPNLGRLAQSIVGLGRLPYTNELRYCGPFTTPNRAVSPQGVGLGRVLNIVLEILKERDPFKGSPTMPLSLLSRVKGCLMLEETVPLERKPQEFLDSTAVTTFPWLIWISDALGKFNGEETCFLANVMSDYLISHLRVTKPLQRTVSDQDPMPDLEGPLYAAILLAHCIHRQVSFQTVRPNLTRVMALAAVRLQFSDLPSGVRLTSAINLDNSCHEHRTAYFIKWADEGSQTLMNDNIMFYLYNELHAGQAFSSSPHLDEEFAVDTFLQAALGIEVVPFKSHPHLSLKSWKNSLQGRLFQAASTHALLILRSWRLQSAACVESRRPEIIRLSLTLTKLMSYDLLACLPATATSWDLRCLATLNFPWHGALEHFVDHLPAEMGALLRLAVREVFYISWLAELWLETLAVLFPPDREADDNLQASISEYLGEWSHSVSSHGSECTSSPGIPSVYEAHDARVTSDATVGLEQGSLARGDSAPHGLETMEPDTNSEINRLADVYASDPGQNHLGAHAPSPHRTIDMIPVSRVKAEPGTAADAIAPTSLLGSVGDHAAGDLANQEAPIIDADERDSYHSIDMRPDPPLESPVVTAFHGHCSTEAPSPHRTIEMIPVSRVKAAPGTAADATVPTLLLESVGDQVAGDHASQEASIIDVDDRSSHHSIDMHSDPRLESTFVTATQDHRSILPKQSLQLLVDRQAVMGVSQPTGNDVPHEDESVECGDPIDDARPSM